MASKEREKCYRVDGEIDDFLDFPNFDGQSDEAAHPTHEEKKVLSKKTNIQPFIRMTIVHSEPGTMQGQPTHGGSEKSLSISSTFVLRSSNGARASSPEK